MDELSKVKLIGIEVESLIRKNAHLRNKILRAQNAFFVDGADSSAAVNMLNILQEEDPHADV